MSDAPPIEGEAEEIPAEPVEAAPAQTTEIPTGADSTDLAAPVNPPSAIMPLDAADVVAGMEAYQALIPQLLDDGDYQKVEGGKKFVKKSGWRKIARAFGLSTEIRSQHIERDEDGMPVRANVVARAVHAPSGQFSDGDGGCSTAETRFAKSAGRQKLENDLLATATTRAKNRAISDLVGMGEVSAEEVQSDAGPMYGPAANDKQRTGLSNALTFLHGNDREAAAASIAEIEKVHGYLPLACCNAGVTAAKIVQAREADKQAAAREASLRHDAEAEAA